MSGPQAAESRAENSGGEGAQAHGRWQNRQLFCCFHLRVPCDVRAAALTGWVGVHPQAAPLKVKALPRRVYVCPCHGFYWFLLLASLQHQTEHAWWTGSATEEQGIFVGQGRTQCAVGSHWLASTTLKAS